MRYLFIFLFSINSFIALCQQNHLKIGFCDYGLFFGNAKKSNGLKFNFLDKGIICDNGLDISGKISSKKSNGIRVGLIFCTDSISNGINIGMLLNSSQRINGLALGGLGIESLKINGIGISSFLMSVDTMNGLFISLVGFPHFMTVKKSELKSKINGVVIGGVYGVDSDYLNGLAFGCFNYSNKIHGFLMGLINSTQELHGFEFGLWNIAENNRFFKRMPFVNFNLKKAVTHTRYKT